MRENTSPTCSTSLLSWGIIGTGLIAERFTRGVAASAVNQLMAVASRTREQAERFGTAFAVERRYAGYDALLEDPDVQAVYIATPHPMHPEWAIKAAQAGKHVLTEKPIGLNMHEAMAMVDTAARHDVFLMEAFMYRCHPQTRMLVELLRNGIIGEVRMIHAEFSYCSNAPEDGRLFAQALGGGGILDVGCYPASLARLVAGAAMGKPFANPVELKACGVLGTTGVDNWTTAVARFENGIVAELSTGLKVQGGSSARIVGSEGWIELSEPWVPGMNDVVPKIRITRDYGHTFEELAVPCEKYLYTYEAEEVSTHLAARQAPAMSWEDSVGNMETLDRWRHEIGLVYEQEKPAKYLQTITNTPLARIMHVERNSPTLGIFTGLWAAHPISAR